MNVRKLRFLTLPLNFCVKYIDLVSNLMMAFKVIMHYDVISRVICKSNKLEYVKKTVRKIEPKKLYLSF